MDFQYFFGIRKMFKKSSLDYVYLYYAGNLEKKRSLTATLHATVTLSTIKAKYMAIIEAVKEAIWLKGLFGSWLIKMTKLSYIPIVKVPYILRKIRCITK
ncbi:polyprotein [Gossypium australe]|uniref:Polyprotein n=1 Tax=Gossypium australe TaxID=47621 RepID=A0A5B6VPU3_9ROSI|nr:polyprotein [Gossypium australe]